MGDSGKAATEDTNETRTCPKAHRLWFGQHKQKHSHIFRRNPALTKLVAPIKITTWLHEKLGR
jgi:hypothetical protein